MYYVIYNSYAGTYVADIHNNIRRFCTIHLAKEFMRDRMLSKVYDVKVKRYERLSTQKKQPI